eukprot:1158926-Pelagomonas_calceolata.AAC.13
MHVGVGGSELVDICEQAITVALTKPPAHTIAAAGHTPGVRGRRVCTTQQHKHRRLRSLRANSTIHIHDLHAERSPGTQAWTLRKGMSLRGPLFRATSSVWAAALLGANERVEIRRCQDAIVDSGPPHPLCNQDPECKYLALFLSRTSLFIQPRDASCKYPALFFYDPALFCQGPCFLTSILHARLLLHSRIELVSELAIPSTLDGWPSSGRAQPLHMLLTPISPQ